MRKIITCIECPRSCSLTLDIENCRLMRLSGHQCPKGELYARSEIENPARILTGTVLAQGLSLKMVPVRTTKPIPKAKILEAAACLRSMKILKAMKMGDVVEENFIEPGVNLVVTRDVS